MFRKRRKTGFQPTALRGGRRSDHDFFDGASEGTDAIAIEKGRVFDRIALFATGFASHGAIEQAAFDEQRQRRRNAARN